MKICLASREKANDLSGMRAGLQRFLSDEKVAEEVHVSNIEL